MDAIPPRRRGWKILGGILAVVALAFGSLYLRIKSVEARRWAEMERKLRALEDEAAARPRERAVLRGEAIPGNSWEDYLGALPTAKERGSLVAIANYLRGGRSEDRERLREILQKQAPAIERFRQGVRRAEGTRTIEWKNPESRGSLSVPYLVDLAMGQAKLWAEEGRVHDAAEILLDAARLAADVGTNADLISTLVSNGSQTPVLKQLQDVLLSGALSAAELRQIAGELDLLDRSYPKVGDALVNGAMCAGWDMRRAGSIGDYLKFYSALYPQGMPHVSAWRFAFSERLMMVDAFERELDWSRRLAAADARSWDDAARITREVDAERAASTNGIPRIAGRWLSGDGFYSMQASFRERRAQLRLLRVAAQFLATGDVLDSEDPFGGMLIHNLKEGRLKVWSRGRNAVDDGGSADGKDILLEVTR